MAASASSPSSHPGPSRPGRRLRPARWSGLPAAELKKPRLIRVAVPRATWLKLEPLWLGGILLLLGNTRAAHRDEKTHLTETARQTVTAHVTGDEREPPADQPPRGPGAAISHELNPLQHTIHQRLRERDWSYGEVARRGGLPRSTVYTLAMTRNLARPPRPATLDGLAKGLDVPVSAVRAAAAESTGLYYYDEVPAEPQHPGDRERELLIASIDELAPEDRRHVAALVESLRKKSSREGPEVRP